MTRVALCSLGKFHGSWPHGAVHELAPEVGAVARFMEKQVDAAADATLFWDPGLGSPPAQWLTHWADVVHCGLSLGFAGRPGSIDFIQPTWMWTTDPPGDREATSWRLSLRACLIKHDVIQQLGGIRLGFESLEAAGLELGHRYLTRGAFVRHVPHPVGGPAKPEVSVHDEVLFARMRFGDFWARWAIGRGVLAGEYSVSQVRASAAAFDVPVTKDSTFIRPERAVETPRAAKVSVLIPTIDRYAYLKKLIPQIAAQTYPVHEIVIVDQTPARDRDPNIAAGSELPIRVLYQDTPGQCSARNRAIAEITGDHVLFLDDDVEISSDLVALHLRCLAEFGVDVSNGVVEEVGAGPLPEGSRFIRASDVFPTGNSMIKRSVLAASGMFDLAYDGKTCEDGDLGIRLYLAGTMMVLDPRISLLHHHAPRGGLRVHNARKVTFASSRQNITHRNIPNPSVVYLGMRYFTERQVREMLALATWGTLRGKGSLARRGLKALYSLFALPVTLRDIHKARRAAEELFSRYPQIALLPES